MRSRFNLVCLSFVLFGPSVSLSQAAPAEKPAKPGVNVHGKEQDARLAELKKQQAANDAEIKKLQTKIKADEEHRAARGQKEKLPRQKDALAETSASDQLRLQQMMDRKTKLEEMISRIMKASSDTSDSVISNMK